MWRLGSRPGQEEENKSLKRRCIHGEVEGRHKRNISDPSGARVEGDPYRVMASFFTGPLNQTPVLPAQRKHNCPLTGRDTIRLERPSSLRGLHWVFHLFCCLFFHSPGRTAGQSLVLRGAILVFFPRNGRLWPSSLFLPCRPCLLHHNWFHKFF